MSRVTRPRARLFSRRRVAFGLGALAISLLAIRLLIIPPSSRIVLPGKSAPSIPNVVLVYPPIPDNTLFRHGAELAAAEVQAAGGIGDFRLHSEMVAQDAADPNARLETLVAQTMTQAADIAKQENLLAVIGYVSADRAMSASSVYDRAGVPYLATHAKSTVLTSLGFQQVFALQCNYADDAKVLARYARRAGLKRFVVLSENNNSGQALSRTFIRSASERGATILYNAELGTHFPTTERLLLYLLDNKSFSANDIDAFFVASNDYEANIDLITRAHSLGLNVPIMGSAGFLAGDIEKRLGPALMKGLTVTSTYAGAATEPAAAAFVGSFESTYGRQPDLYSAIGYDAVKLLAHAVTVAGKADRHLISDALRGLRFRSPFVGVTGAMNFDNLGRITNRPMFVFRHDGVAFRKVATFEHSCADDTPANGQVPGPGNERMEPMP